MVYRERFESHSDLDIFFAGISFENIFLNHSSILHNGYQKIGMICMAVDGLVRIMLFSENFDFYDLVESEKWWLFYEFRERFCAAIKEEFIEVDVQPTRFIFSLFSFSFLPLI